MDNSESIAADRGLFTFEELQAEAAEFLRCGQPSFVFVEFGQVTPRLATEAVMGVPKRLLDSMVVDQPVWSVSR
jgi:hypothetical protein